MVSVIMPVHNGAQFLREAIESALAQDYTPVEIIVVDDGSTDATPQILASFGSRIRHIRQTNSGAAAARNAALQASRGEYLAFLDADDLWLPQKLRVQIDYLGSHPDVDLVASSWKVLSETADAVTLRDSIESATALEIDAGRPGWLYNELLMDCVVHTTTVVMRRRLMEKIGLFDVGLRRGQDYDYWLRASRVTQIHSLAAELSAYRLHAANSTWKPQMLNYGAIVLERALKTWGRTGPDGRVTPLAPVRQRLSELWSSFGYQHALAGNNSVAFESAVRSIAAWPLATKPWKLLAAATLGTARRPPAAVPRN